MTESFLVTGAHGCIGAWVVAQLAAEDVPVVAYDAGDDPRRLRLVTNGEPSGVTTVRGDVTDLDGFARTLEAHAVTHVIHLAALQVPFCRADPPLGAHVNVVGTVNVLEAVARRGDGMAPVVYASSIAAYDALDDGEPGMAGTPGTLYGVYKRANEGTALVYAAERGVASVGLRPHTVYGPGRDQGLTSEPTVAMLAAAAGTGHRMAFGGGYQLQYGPDVALAFIAAARSGATGAAVHDLPGHAVHADDVVAAIEAAAPEVRGRIAYDLQELPFPPAVDGASFTAAVGPVPTMTLADGVADAIARFRDLLARGLVAPPS